MINKKKTAVSIILIVETAVFLFFITTFTR